MAMFLPAFLIPGFMDELEEKLQSVVYLILLMRREKQQRGLDWLEATYLSRIIHLKGRQLQGS